MWMLFKDDFRGVQSDLTSNVNHALRGRTVSHMTAH